MSTTLRPGRVLDGLLPSEPGRLTGAHRWAAGAVLAVFVVRLTYLHLPLANDEAGFLLVAQQWRPGSSLYGDHWVDRPPLLLALYQLAAATGGAIGLRLIGMVAAAVTIWFLTLLVRDAFGDLAARAAAVVSGALLVSPLYGADDVNGELLAAPFLAVGMWAAVRVVHRSPGRQVVTPAAGAGAAAALALLVKQNMADVVVFAAVLWAVAALHGRLERSRLAVAVAAAAAGAAVATTAVAAWAWWHGTSPPEVLWATYPFRVEAAEVVAGSLVDDSVDRLGWLALAFLGTGVPGLLVLLAVAVHRWAREERVSTEPVVPATVALLVFTGFSVLAGGVYWLHYLVQTVPPVTLAAGALVALVPAGSVLARARTAFIGLVVVSSVVAAVVSVAFLRVDRATTVGRTVGSSAAPGDTLVFLFGDAQTNLEAGLGSPYEHLWSLPSRVLDPEMSQLTALLRGPQAPTWLLVRGPRTQQRLADSGAWAVILDRYVEAGEVCGQRVWLLESEQRPALTRQGECAGRTLLSGSGLIP